MKNKPKHILVKFTEDEHTQLKLIATIRGISLTSLIRNAIFLDVKNDLKKVEFNK